MIHHKQLVVSIITLIAAARLLAQTDLDFADPAKAIPPPAWAVGQANRQSTYNALPDFVTPPKGFGNVPFYWWLGDKLTKERLSWQMDQLKDHSTSSLQINYAHDDKGGKSWGFTFPSDPALFSDEWWDLTKWFLKESKKRGMSISLSDYTLGFGQGWYVDDILAKYPDVTGYTLAHATRPAKGSPFKMDINVNTISVSAFNPATKQIVDLRKHVNAGVLSWNVPEGDWNVSTIETHAHDMSLDPMNPKSGKGMIETFFGAFEQKNPGEGGKGLNFFFSDELVFGVSGNMWNGLVAEEFKKQKGYDVVPELAAIFTDIGPRTAKIRLDYYDVIVRLQEMNYFKPVFDWHQERGMIYGCDHGGRGRDVVEFGDYFRTQRWNQGPGSDQPGLGKNVSKAKVAASIAHLYQRPRVWLEGFYSSGWGTTSENVADAIFYNFTCGYNLLSFHGLYYSTKGGWWEWAPPCNHFHMPYWVHMKSLMKCVERLSFLMSQGHHRADVAVLYPVAAMEVDRTAGRKSADTAFRTGDALYAKGIDFDYMDFESLARAKVIGKTLQVSGEIYRALVLPSMKAVRWTTLQKAVEFQKAGGLVIIAGDAPVATDRAGSNDPEVDTCVAQLTTRVEMATDVIAVIEKTFPRDYTGEGIINHRRIGARDVYMIYDASKDSTATFRATGKVELWNPWDGTTRPLEVVKQSETETTLQLPLDKKDVQIVVFSPGKATLLDATNKKSEIAKTIAIDSKDWGFEIKPALDNRFGDFHWPATDTFIGAEARIYHYQTGGAVKQEAKPVETEAGFGPKMWVLGPLPKDFKNDDLVKLSAIQPKNALPFNGKNYTWKPYEFSWRWGKKGDPGHQGYHGLKGVVTDEFLCLGKPSGGKNETIYTTEEAGPVYYVWTTVPVEKQTVAYPDVGGALKPDAIWVNAQLVTAASAVTLKPGANTLLARYTKAGRGYIVMTTKKPTLQISTEAFSPTANWIWHPKEATGTFKMQKRFSLDALPKKASVRITADDSYTLYVNGVSLNSLKVGLRTTWTVVDSHDVLKQLKKGQNEIVVEASNRGGDGAAIAELYCDGQSFVSSDATWTVFKTDEQGSQPAKVISSFKDSLWYNHPMGPPKLLDFTVPNAKVDAKGRPVYEEKPLTMSWWKNQDILPFDLYPEIQTPTGVYTFMSPPNLRALIIDDAQGTVDIQVGEAKLEGKKQKVNHEKWRAETSQLFTVEKPSATPRLVTLTVKQHRGAYAGSALPEYVRLTCGEGRFDLGDWSLNDGLSCYSGSAWYRKEIDVPAAKKVVLNLGEVSSTAEVFVNGKTAGIRIMQPWTFDITSLVKTGAKNKIEVLVYSAMDNHYRTIPTHYRRPNKSGLFGPVTLEITE